MKLEKLAKMSIALLTLAVVFGAPTALANHDWQGCTPHGGDSDGDDVCNDVDPDNDNDGAPDGCDPSPNSQNHTDAVIFVVKKALGACFPAKDFEALDSVELPIDYEAEGDDQVSNLLRALDL